MTPLDLAMRLLKEFELDDDTPHYQNIQNILQIPIPEMTLGNLSYIMQSKEFFPELIDDEIWERALQEYDMRAEENPNWPEIGMGHPLQTFSSESFDDWQNKNAGEPMDIAFQILKAPYLPESFTPTQDEFQMPNQPDWAQGAQGVFGHPEMPQVQYPMSISYMGKNPYVEVKDPASGETIAHGTFRYEPHPYDEEEPGHFVSDDTWVHEDHRGKRIGPSMYNFLVNQMERLQGPEVKGSEHMTKPGERMWLREQGTAEPGTPWRRTI